jgi:hypothetical protein
MRSRRRQLFSDGNFRGAYVARHYHVVQPEVQQALAANVFRQVVLGQRT